MLIYRHLFNQCFFICRHFDKHKNRGDIVSDEWIAPECLEADIKAFNSNIICRQKYINRKGETNFAY